MDFAEWKFFVQITVPASSARARVNSIDRGNAGLLFYSSKTADVVFVDTRCVRAGVHATPQTISNIHTLIA